MSNISFKLTIKLATPVVMGRLRLTLDGLLSAAIFRKLGLKGESCIPYIPLEQAGGIFKASSMFVNEGSHLSHLKLNRIMSLKGLGDLTPDHFLPNSAKGDRYLSVDQARGPYKSNLSEYSALNATEVCFYGVGDALAVKELIDIYITGIGAQANAGAGQILSTEIEPLAAGDMSHWVTESGKPARQLPLEVWEGLPDIDDKFSEGAANITVRLPYWDTANLARGVFPTELTHF